MSDDQQRIYCGNGKKITTQFGDLMKLSLTADDVQKLSENLSNGWVNLVMKERRNPSATGMTHYLEVDTWKPDPNKAGAPNQAPAANNSAPSAQADEEEISVEDLPF